MRAVFYRQQHGKTMCVTTWSLPIDVLFFRKASAKVRLFSQSFNLYNPDF